MPVNVMSLLITVDAAVEGAKEKLRETGTEAEGMGGSFSKAGLLMSGGLLAGAAAVIELGKQIVETTGEASKQQNAMAQMSQALKTTHDASGETTGSLSALADKMSGLTTFTKLQYLSSEQMMLQFTHIGKDIFPAAQMAAANLSTRFGVDLAGASRIVGMALDNPATAMGRLTRYIGPLDASTKEYIKTLVAHGETAKAQTVILDLLNQKFGGAAVTAGQTWSGALTIAKNRLEEQKISIVNALLPALTTLLNGYNKITEHLGEKLQPILEHLGGWLNDEAKNVIPLFNKGVADMKQVWTQLSPVFGTLGQSFTPLLGMMGQIMPMFMQMSGSLSVTGMAGQALGPAMQQLLPTLLQLGTVLGSTLLQAMQVLVPQIVLISTNIIKALIPAFLQIAVAVQPLISLFGQALVGAIKGLVPTVAGITGVIADLSTQMTHATPLGTALKDVVVGVAGAFAAWKIGSLIVDLGRTTAAIITNTVAWIAHAPAVIADTAATLYLKALYAADFVTNLAKTTASVITQTAAWIAHAAAVTASWVAQKAMQLGGLIASLIASIPAIAAQTVAWAANAVAVIAATWPILAIIAAIAAVIAIGILLVTHWSQVTGFINTVWKATLTWLSNAWTGLVGVAQTAWNAVTNAVVGAVNAVVTWIGTTWGNLVKTVQTIWNNIVNTLVTAFLTAYNHSYLFQNIVDFIVNAFNNVKTFIANVWNGITSFLGAVWSGILAAASAIWNGITGLISLYINAELLVIRTVWNAISGFLSATWGAISGAANAIWSVITNVISSFINLELKGIQAVWGVISGWLSSTWNAISGAASAIWNGITNALTNIWRGMQNIVQTIWSAISGFLSGLWNTIRINAAGAWNAISGAVGNAVQGLFNNIGNIMGGLGNAAGTWAAGLRDGFVNGVNGAWKAISGALQGTITNIINFVKGGLGIHSPSTVFADIGKNAILGFIHGFTGNDISGHLTAFIHNSLGGIGNVAQSLIKAGLIDISQIGRAGLSTLQGWGVNVGNFLSQLGGGISGVVNGIVGGGPMPSGSLAQWLQQAIALTGVPSNWLSGLTIIAQNESGGNPNAVNRWDINWVEGHPSEGLMQTIPATFAANEVAGHGNIFNPVDNAAAAINYILRRYGSVWNVPGVRSVLGGGRYVGYDTGGWITEPIAGVGLRSGNRYNFAQNNVPEYVTPAGNMAGKSQHMQPIVVHVHGDMQESSVARMQYELRWAARLHGGY
jgi:SLT domain-containing protein/phage-related protein